MPQVARRMTAPSAATRVERLDSVEQLRSLRAEWEDLLAGTTAPSIFLTPDWVLEWLDVFAPTADVRSVAVRAVNGSLIGLALCYVRAQVEGLPPGLRALLCIGQEGDTLAEELGVIAAPGRESEVAQAVAEVIRQDIGSAYDLVRLERVRGDDPTLPHLERALATAGLHTDRYGEQPSPYLPLPADVESLRGARSKNFRKQLRGARNRLAREGVVTTRLAGADIDHDAAMDALIDLHRQRWGPDDGSFRTPAYIEFHRRLSRRLAASGRLLLAVLCVDDRPVAARYDFLYAERVWCFQGGRDPALDPMRVGTLLTDEVMALGIERGAREYAFLSGDDGYKRRWADGARTLTDFHAYSDTRPIRAWQRRVRLRGLLRRFPPARWLAARLRRP